MFCLTSIQKTPDMTRVEYRMMYTASFSRCGKLLSQPPGSYDCEGDDGDIVVSFLSVPETWMSSEFGSENYY